MQWRVVGVVLAVACGGVDRDEFAEIYASHYCEAYLTCGDQAANVFDGIDTVDECLALESERILQPFVGCKFKKRRAKQCLEFLGEVSCPTEEGADLTSVFPPICQQVFVKCPLNGAQGEE